MRAPTAASTLPLLFAVLLAATAFAGCSEPSNPAGPDSDHDGVTDAEELAGWDVVAVTQNGTLRYHVTSDPYKADTSGGGISDLAKITLGLDPRINDTDRDGLTDCQEVYQKSLAACQDPNDQRGDGGYGTRANWWDSDNDTLGDGAEVNTYHSNPLAVDTDGDGLTDGKELLYGGSPTVKDTDGDGCVDGLDPLPAVAQLLGPGLQSVKLPSGNVHLIFFLGGTQVRSPATGDWQASGQFQDASSMEPAPLAGGCGTSPEHPWVMVQVAGQRPDGSLLDLTSKNPGGANRAYWNLRTGERSWSEDGSAPFKGPFAWSGNDGEVRFSPLLKDANQSP